MSDTKENQAILTGKNLFVLYLVISSNFLAGLFGCKIQDAFNKNIILKHVLGFLTLYFFVTLTETSEYFPSQLSKRFLFAILIYIWFMITTKMKAEFWVVTILMLGLVYVLQLQKDNENKEKNPDKNKVEIFKKVQYGLIIMSGILTVIGFLIYLGEKKYEYGSEFSMSKFLIGNVVCKGDDLGGKSAISMLNSIKSAFKKY
jgi:hypothetical protein